MSFKRTIQDGTVSIAQWTQLVNSQVGVHDTPIFAAYNDGRMVLDSGNVLVTPGVFTYKGKLYESPMTGGLDTEPITIGLWTDTMTVREVKEGETPNFILHSYRPGEGIIDHRIWQAGGGLATEAPLYRIDDLAPGIHRVVPPSKGTKVFHTSELTWLESDGDTWKTSPVLDITKHISVPWKAKIAGVGDGQGPVVRDVTGYNGKVLHSWMSVAAGDGDNFSFLWDVSIEVPAVDGRDYRFAIPQGLMKQFPPSQRVTYEYADGTIESVLAGVVPWFWTSSDALRPEDKYYVVALEGDNQEFSLDQGGSRLRDKGGPVRIHAQLGWNEKNIDKRFLSDN